jgi:hypothetical protein
VLWRVQERDRPASAFEVDLHETPYVGYSFSPFDTVYVVTAVVPDAQLIEVEQVGGPGRIPPVRPV